MTLTLERLAQTIEYYRKHAEDLRSRVNGLGIKMGVDPEHDYLVVPRSWCKRYGWSERDFPDWIKASEHTEQGFIFKGVRNRGGG